MTNLNSLFLSQAYKDCWDDYNRSLKLRSFPRWDYVILTEYSCAVTPQVRQTGNRLSGLAGTAYASLFT